MIETYLNLVKTYPITSAMVQFAILGTFGDIISKWMIARKFYSPFSIKVYFLKMVEWAVLAFFIKYAFVGFHGFVDHLVSHHFLPDLSKLGYSFAISLTMNLQFGLFLVVAHRYLDNLIAGENNWQNIEKSMFSLIWFWLPAHTITFILDKPFQIGLAALWSVALGIILGFYNRKK
jgi:hypothetical protein